MISDATLKLVVGIAVGGFIYYKYSKNKVKQEKLTKDIRIGRQIPFEQGKPIKRALKRVQKQGRALEPSYEFL